jgi:hypothetical protein
VKITVAVASKLSFLSPGTKLGNSAIGTSLATAAAQILSVSFTCLGMSSSRMSFPLGMILNRSSTLDEVSTWVIWHCSIEESTNVWLAE